MTITNELKTRKIDLVIVESVNEHYPSHHVEVEIETENIHTFNNFVWLSVSDIEEFLESLDTLDKYRKGQATLQSMSPEDFQLTLKAVDDLGHVSATSRLRKKVLTHDYAFDTQIEFEIDPSTVRTIISEFKNLMKQNGR